MAKINIAVAGCLGRMGKELSKQIIDNNKLEFVGGFEHKKHKDINKQFKNVLTCGKPTLRLGIYRSGNIRTPNSHSIVDYKNIEIEKIKIFPWDLKSKKGLIYKKANYFCLSTIKLQDD